VLYNPQCNTRSTDESNSTVLGLRITTLAYLSLCVRYKSVPVLEEILGLRLSPVARLTLAQPRQLSPPLSPHSHLTPPIKTRHVTSSRPGPAAPTHRLATARLPSRRACQRGRERALSLSPGGSATAFSLPLACLSPHSRLGWGAEGRYRPPLAPA
jgi:hypothetical protein